MRQEALFTISNGLYVLGAKAKVGFAGSLVDAVSQVAVSPDLIVVSCMNTSYTKECIETSGEFSLSVLPQETPPQVVAEFGYQSSREVNKWVKVNAVEIDSLPYIEQALAKIRAKVVNKLVYPNNTLFIAEVTDAFDCRSGEPLTYKHYRDGYKEKCVSAFNEAKQPLSEKQAKTQNKKWVCTICGYVYDGDIPFENLPEDWRCPLCGVGKELFELQDV